MYVYIICLYIYIRFSGQACPPLTCIALAVSAIFSPRADFGAAFFAFFDLPIFNKDLLLFIDLSELRSLG